MISPTISTTRKGVTYQKPEFMSNEDMKTYEFAIRIFSFLLPVPIEVNARQLAILIEGNYDMDNPANKECVRVLRNALGSICTS